MDPLKILEGIGSTALLVCLVPQFLRTIKLGRASDVSVAFLSMVLLGSLSLVPVAYYAHQTGLVATFSANLFVWGTVLYYRLRPRRASVPSAVSARP